MHNSPTESPRPAISDFTLGPFQTNTYLVRVGSACWIVDPSFEPDDPIATIRDQRLNPEAIVLTHAHADHIAGVADVRRAFPAIPILIHEAEADWPASPHHNLSAGMGMPISAPMPTRLLRDGDTLALGPTRWQVIHTPGHSLGGITIHHAESGQALVGDTLFAGSIGRSDFPGSDPRVLEHSIRTRLYTLPPETRCYPGHGPVTTIQREMRTNPFVRA